MKGLSRLTENQVVGASGLKLGQMAGEPEFQQAAQKLGSTGLFTDLTYSYQYSGGESDLEFQVKENEKLLPIIFENFVWFSDEDLLTQLRARIPLFNGRVPAEGDLTEAVASALVAILHEHKIAGEVQYLAFAQENGPVQAYEYKVSFHSIVIRNVDFPGAAQDELPALQAAAKSLAGSDYLRTHMQAQEHFNFLPVYEARGYLKAKFADSQARIVEDGGQTIVDVSCPVTRGGLYKLKSLEFDGDKAVSAEQLRNLVHLKFGDPANAVELADDVEQMQKLYGTKGYLSAAIDPEADMDEASGTVTYRMLVTEGELYRMGDLNIDGLPEANATRMAAQWQMKKGDPFDNTYLQKFFSILYRDFDLQRSYAVSSKQAINEQNKSVSVSLHFVAKS
ncbi:MAG TPA: POTRA domain-containing protein [Terriglobales bacterium]|nr:POTRA domain-containing protein [Terriglobales bacterium]